RRLRAAARRPARAARSARRAVLVLPVGGRAEPDAPHPRAGDRRRLRRGVPRGPSLAGTSCAALVDSGAIRAMRIRPPLALLLLLATGSAPPGPLPPACKSVGEALQPGSGAVALVTGSRDDLRCLERERLLLEKPEYREAAQAVRWFRVLSYVPEGK